LYNRVPTGNGTINVEYRGTTDSGETVNSHQIVPISQKVISPFIRMVCSVVGQRLSKDSKD
jgi:hypothetical protein